MLRATALPAVVMITVLLLWMYFGDWQSSQATNTEAHTMAAAAASQLYSTTSSSGSDSFSLTGGVSGAVPVTGEKSVTSNISDKKFMKATLHTTKGDIQIEFDASAPNTVENFTKLASSGFYDGTKFHRVIAGFMIQGGDPLTKDDSKEAMWGTGGPGYTFADEIHPGNSNVIGSVSMANAGPNTNGSQFFINVADNNFLDSKHTVFAHVISGTDAINAIVSSRTGAQDRPIDPIVINSVTLQ